MTDPRNHLAKAFDKRAREFIAHHAATFYTPVEFMGQVGRYGAVGTLLKLINEAIAGKRHRGFTRAWEAGRLEDCTIEAVVWNEPQWRRLLDGGKGSGPQTDYLRWLALECGWPEPEGKAAA